MIIREDLDTKLRKALAIHYGLDKVYVQKINPTGFDAYRIKIKINDVFQWVHYLDELYLMALHITYKVKDHAKCFLVLCMCCYSIDLEIQ